jgi:hypothetical protein
MQMFGTSLKMFLMPTKICSEHVNEHFLDLYAAIYPPGLAISERDTDFSGLFPYPDPIVSGHNQGFFF